MSRLLMIFLFFLSSCANDDNCKYNDNLYLIPGKSRPSMYGYINYQGKVIIPADVYNWAYYKNDTWQENKFELLGYDVGYKEGFVYVFDSSGEKVYQVDIGTGDGVSPNNQVPEMECLANNLVYISRDEVGGVYDYISQKKLFDCEEYILEYKGKFLVKTGGEYCIVNKNGIISSELENVCDISYYSRDKYIIFNSDGRWGVKDISGADLVPCIYEEILHVFDDGNIAAKYDGTLSIFSPANKKLIDGSIMKFMFLDDLSCVGRLADLRCVAFSSEGKQISEQYDLIVKGKDCYIATQNNKMFHVDTSFNKIYDSSFDYVSYYYDGLAAVKKENALGFIDKSGVFIIEPAYDYVTNFAEGYALAAVDEGDGVRGWIIDRYGNKVVVNGVPKVKNTLFYYFKNGLMLLEFADGYGYINTKGETIAKIDENIE